MTEGKIPPLPLSGPDIWGEFDHAMTVLQQRLDGTPLRWDSFVDEFFGRYSSWFSGPAPEAPPLQPPSVSEP